MRFIPDLPRGNIPKALLLGSMMLLSVLALGAQAHAQQASISVSKYSLPSGSNSIALATNGTRIFYGSEANGTVFVVNPTNGNVKHVLPPNSAGCCRWTSVTYHSGTLLLMNLQTSNATFTGGVYEVRLSTIALVSGDKYNGSWGKLDIAESCGAGCYSAAPVGSALTQMLFSSQLCQCSPSQWVYAASGSTFWKIGNESTPNSDGWGATSICGTAFPSQNTGPTYPSCYYAFPYDIPSNWGFTPSGAGNFDGITNDTHGDVLVTDRADGVLMVYNATTNSESHYTGFSRPVGVSVIGEHAYISQNVAGGGIVNFSLISGTAVGTIATSGGTPFASLDYAGKVVWDSNATDGHVCQVGPTVLTTYCTTTGESNYYLAAPPSAAAVYFGYLGSSGVGEVTGLDQSNSTTTTYTNTSTATVTPTYTTTTTVVTTPVVTTTVVSNTTETLTNTTTITSTIYFTNTTVTSTSTAPPVTSTSTTTSTAPASTTSVTSTSTLTTYAPTVTVFVYVYVGVGALAAAVGMAGVVLARKRKADGPS